MSYTIRKVDYFYTQVPDKPGEGSRVLSALSAAGVNLLAFSGFPSGRKAQIDFIPEDPVVFKATAKQTGLKLSLKKTGFLIQGEDRIGALSEVMGKLACAGVNVTAVDAVGAGEGRFGAILWVKSQDLRKATKAIVVPPPAAAPGPVVPSPTAG